MGFFNKLKKSILSGKEKAEDETKRAAGKAEKAVEDSAEKAKEAADKAENAVDDTATAASDKLKKE